MNNYFVKNSSNLGRAADIFKYVFLKAHDFLSLIVQLVLRPAKKTQQIKVSLMEKQLCGTLKR